MNIIILHSAAISIIEAEIGGVVDLFSRQDDSAALVQMFPDGSMQLSGNTIYEDVRRILVASGLLGNSLIWKTLFRSLAPFHTNHYHFVYSNEYQNKLGECNFINGQSPVMPGESAGERELRNLLVTVGFRHRPNAQIRRKYCVATIDWAESISRRGIFDEGPASLASPGVEFRGTRAQFRIDASRSGQNTLNWLSICIFNFGDRIHAVEAVKFASEDLLDVCFGPAHDAPLLVEFQRDIHPSDSPEEREISSDVLTSDAATISKFSSEKFSVLESSDAAWDRLRITVAFTRSLADHERAEFEALMLSWVNLARYGAFGGTGSDSNSNPFFKNTREMHVDIDMGDTNIDISLPILINSIEGFHMVSTPIDTVIFGLKETNMDNYT